MHIQCFIPPITLQTHFNALVRNFKVWKLIFVITISKLLFKIHILFIRIDFLFLSLELKLTQKFGLFYVFLSDL